jgi:hypothetical protein
MAIVRHLAVVSESKPVKLADLAAAVAALQIQITRDFTPVWRRPATIAAFPKLTDVPLDYWPVIVRDDIPYDAQGIHLDRDGLPFSLVLYDPSWSLTTSHEVLEMLGDPLGRRTRTAPSIKAGQGRVRYLVEVCDPSEASEFAYDINGVTVSDFYYPSYFDAEKTNGRRYSLTGAISAPRKVLKGGYLSWQDPATGHWWQQTYFGTKKFRDLGVFSKGTNPRRGTDGSTEVPRSVMTIAKAAGGGSAALAAANGGADSRSRASFLRAAVQRIIDASAGS